MINLEEKFLEYYERRKPISEELREDIHNLAEIAGREIEHWRAMYEDERIRKEHANSWNERYRNEINRLENILNKDKTKYNCVNE